MSYSNEVRQFPDGCTVVLTGKEGHPENGKQGAVIGALPNPSGRKENQWYDVRFAGNRFGRFNQRYLVQAQEENSSAA